MHNKRWLAWVGILQLLGLLLAGCQSFEYQDAPPTPQPITVDLTPAVRTWQPALYACASTLPETALFTHEILAPHLDLQRIDLGLRLGAPHNISNYFAVQIGEEQITLIVHPENPLELMDSALLRAMYAGQVVHWADAAPDFNAAVQVWTYPSGDDMRQVWEAVLFGAAPPQVQGWLAPDPQAMLEAVASEPGAMGFIPRSWLGQGSVKEIALAGDVAASLRQPVLALSPEEPQGAVRALLACLQAAQQK